MDSGMSGLFSVGGLSLTGGLEPLGMGKADVLSGNAFPPSAFATDFQAQAIVAQFFALPDWKAKTGDLGEFMREDTPDNLKAWVTELLTLVPYRARRLGEIKAQAQGVPAVFGAATMAAGRRNLRTLISVGLAVGHTLGMYWKGKHMMARPVQIYPGILPVIETPAHPSFPSNHSLQSHLIANLLGAAYRDAGAPSVGEKVLVPLANRMAKNREIAGVHFSVDSDAGKVIAKAASDLLGGIDDVKEIRRAAAKELGALGPLGEPGEPGWATRLLKARGDSPQQELPVA